jgi:Cytochrome c
MRCLALLACGCLSALAACDEASPPPHLTIAGADPARGRALIYAYGCGLCHVIPGIRGARGTVGPPLDRYAERNLVAGILPNAPTHLIAWLMDPPALAPRTGMPEMSVTVDEARDIASYLYTLGASAAAVYPPNPPLALQSREEPVLNTPYPTSGGYQESGTAAGGAAPASPDGRAR